MSVEIRPMILETDAEAIASLLSSIQVFGPMSGDTFIQAENKLPPEALRFRIVAVDLEDQVVAYGHATRTPWMASGNFDCGVVVAEDVRNRGVGGALLAGLEEYTCQYGTVLKGTVQDDDPVGLAFAHKHAFVTDRHVFRSVLDLESFDPGPFRRAVSEATAMGFMFGQVGQNSPEEEQHRLYTLLEETNRDNPLFDGGTAPPFERWWPALFGKMTRSTFIVASLENQFAGVAWLRHNLETGDIFNNFTGVGRPFRSKGLATALKVLAIEEAQRLGVKTMRTGNDSLNGPMLAVNRKLGYTPCPGRYIIKKVLV